MKRGRVMSQANLMSTVRAAVSEQTAHLMQRGE